MSKTTQYISLIKENVFELPSVKINARLYAIRKARFAYASAYTIFIESTHKKTGKVMTHRLKTAIGTSTDASVNATLYEEVTDDKVEVCLPSKEYNYSPKPDWLQIETSNGFTILLNFGICLNLFNLAFEETLSQSGQVSGYAFYNLLS